MNTPGKQMSDALKDRLKKSSRFYLSPVAVTNTCSPAHSPLCDPSHSPLPATPSQQTKSWLKHGANSAFKSPVINDTLKHSNLQTPTGASRFADHQTLDGEGTRRILVEDFVKDGSSVNDDHTECLTDLVKDNSHKVARGLKRKELSADECQIIEDRYAPATSSLHDASNENISELLQTKKKLLMKVSEKEEKIRKLKMVKLYRSKHNLETLDCLTTKWKTVSQQAVLRLYNLTPEPRPTLTQLIDHLRIDYDMIDYSVDDESFVS